MKISGYDRFDRSVVASINSKYLNTDLAINTIIKRFRTRKISKRLNITFRPRSTIYINGIY